MQYFNYCTGLTMTNERFDALFGGPPRKAESQLTQREMDIARSIQEVTEEVVLRLARTRRTRRPARRTLPRPAASRSTAWPTAACCARARSRRSGSSRRPATPAARSARRCVAWHELPRPRAHAGRRPRRDAGRLPRARVRRAPRSGAQLDAAGAVYEELDDAQLLAAAAEALADGEVVGWFQGRMEFGPRALGARSIIGDPRSAEMQSGDEPEDQVPRVVPAVRAVGAGGARQRLLRARPRRARTC